MSRLERPGEWLTSRRVAVLCVVLLICTMIPLLIMAFYDHPCSDDYNYGLYVAQTVRTGGSFWEVLRAAGRKTAETYQNWQGTFSAVFLMALQPSAFGESYYALTPYLMIGSLLFATFFFLKAVCVDRLKMSKADWVILSCAVSFFSVHCAPSAFEGFFWFNGALFYTFFFALSLCLYACLLKFFFASTRKTAAVSLIVSGLLAFLIGGGNYPTALLSIVILLGAAIWSFVRKLPMSRRIGVLICLLMEGAAFLISIVAPGNAVRQSYFQEHPNAVEAVCRALVEAIREIMDFTTLPFLLVLLALIPLLYRSAARLKFRFPLPLLAPVAAVCILGVELTPPIYAMSGIGAVRMQDLYYDTYCLLAVAVAFYFCGWASHRYAVLPKNAGNRARLRQAFVLGVFVCFCVSFLCQTQLRSMSGVSAFLSLKNGEAQAYDQQVEARLALYHDSEVKDVEVEPYTAHPALLKPSGIPDVTADPENLTNQRVAAFYEKDTVRLKESRDAASEQ